MNNQGFWGAMVQYWTVDEKPRLHRRNTWFEDHQPSNYFGLKLALTISIVASAIVIFWGLLGVTL